MMVYLKSVATGSCTLVVFIVLSPFIILVILTYQVRRRSQIKPSTLAGIQSHWRNTHQSLGCSCSLHSPSVLAGNIGGSLADSASVHVLSIHTSGSADRK